MKYIGWIFILIFILGYIGLGIFVTIYDQQDHKILYKYSSKVSGLDINIYIGDRGTEYPYKKGLIVNNMNESIQIKIIELFVAMLTLYILWRVLRNNTKRATELQVGRHLVA